MDLAKEIISDVILNRTSIGGAEKKEILGELTSPVIKLEEGLREAELILNNGLNVAVHVLLGHENCLAEEAIRCKAAKPLEVWTLRVLYDSSFKTEGKPAMLPIFLKQAIRSQLHFSPIKSWFAKTLSVKEQQEIKPNCLFLYRISTSSHFEAYEYGMAESHNFPPCKLDAKTWLCLHVKWLKKENFPKYLEKCPCTKVKSDEWIFPEIKDIFNTSSTLTSIGKAIIITTGTQVSISDNLTTDKEGKKKSISRQNNKEVEYRKLSDDSREQRQQNVLNLLSKRKSMSEIVLPINKVPLIHSNIIPIIDNLKEQRSPLAKKYRDLRNLYKTRGEFVDRNQEIFNRFHPITKLPLHSSPVPPLSRKTGVNIFEDIKNSQENNFNVNKKQIFTPKNDENLNTPAQISALPKTFNFSNNNSTKTIKHRSQRSLLCNFEESILNGRLNPSNYVDERFQLKISICQNVEAGVSSSRPIHLSVSTYYYNSTGEEAPSLYLGYCNLKPLGKKAIQLPKQCTIQAILFNPHGSVVKLFLVEVDVRDMPARSKTFVRQRTFSGGSQTNNNDPLLSNTENLNKGRKFEKLSSTKLPQIQPQLKFLIHLRLASDSRKRVYLHSDIRMLLSNKGGDLEGLETISLNLPQLVANTQMPIRPKYSPIK